MEVFFNVSRTELKNLTDKFNINTHAKDTLGTVAGIYDWFIL